MPLWTLSVRTLACRQSSRFHLPPLPSQWRWGRHRHQTSSYSTALPRSQPDDNVWASTSLPQRNGNVDGRNDGQEGEGRDSYAAAVPVTPLNRPSQVETQGRSRAQPSSQVELSGLRARDNTEARVQQNLVLRKHWTQHVARTRKARRRRRAYKWAQCRFRMLSARISTVLRFRRQRRKAVAGTKHGLTRKVRGLRLGRLRLNREMTLQDLRTPDAKSTLFSPMQTVARFRGPDGQLRTMPAVDGRLWSTANPYTLTRIYPYQATPETTAQRWTYWERQYAKIASFYATYRERHVNEIPKIPTLQPNAIELVDSIVVKLDSGQAILTIDDIRFEGGNHRLHGWQQAALWFLAHQPWRMVDFLAATNTIEDLQSHVIEDSLLHLARVFKHTKAISNMRDLTEVFCAMVEQRPQRQLTFRNEFIRLLMNYVSNDLRYRLFETIKRSKVKVHPYTWLHFATHFANNDRFEMGLEALLIAHENGATWEGRRGYAFRSNCTTILRRSSQQPDGLRVCLRVVSTLVDIGVKFNLPICNVIMLNAIEAGDLKTAFAVYHSLKERGLKPDEVTFLVLLKGCRMNVDDAQLLDEIIRDAITNLNLRKSEKVATEILHCLALHHSKHNPATALNTLAEAYAQLFDLAPLRKLELPISPTLQSRLSNEAPMAPTRHALTFMIGAAIQHYLATAPSPTAHAKHILNLYTRWRGHVTNETAPADPLLASLATTDHVPNTFLSAFIKHPKTLLLAARVVRDLQRPLPQTARITQTKPTVQTWSIFLLGFTQHGQMKLAEQVLTYMRKQDIEPNHVTWNTLIRGYAQVQDVEGTAAALREAEREGMVWDVWTHTGLRRLRERERLEEELRRQRNAENLDFTSDLKEDIGRRLERVESDAQVSNDAHVQCDTQTQGFGDSPAEIAEQGDLDYRPFG